MIRMYAGLEDPGYLIRDLERGFEGWKTIVYNFIFFILLHQ